MDESAIHTGARRNGADAAGALAAPWMHTAEEVIEALRTSVSGLCETEAGARALRYGPNALPAPERRSRARILLEQFASPLIYVLIGACAVTIVVGLYSDASIIAAVLVFNAAMGYIQEYRAERSMQALLGIIATRASVLRGGLRRDIRASELVPGDIVEIEAGDLVPADLRLQSSSRLRVDESMLTGESVPTAKLVATLGTSRQPIAERSNMVYQGTAVIAGHGVGIVTAIGAATELGTIAREIRDVRRDMAPIQTRIRRLGRVLTLVVLLSCIAVFLAGIAQRREPFEMFLTAVATAVSVIPEGLPIVMTVALSVGVRRMARRNAIVRRMAAVETLGSCTVIVTDKTGTLTENRMTVKVLWSDGCEYTVTGGSSGLSGTILLNDRAVHLETDDPAGAALSAGVLANEASMRIIDEERSAAELAGDPTDCALHVAAWKARIVRDELVRDLVLVAELPFDPERRCAGAVFRDARGELRSFLKGAPERVAEMCTSQAVAGSDGAIAIDRDGIRSAAAAIAGRGMRVLALADGEGATAADGLVDGSPVGLRFLGLTGMLDPPRPEVIDAVKGCREAGIRVLLVTGDHASTARAIALEVGIGDDDPLVLDGATLDDLDDATLVGLMPHYAVFARMCPRHKLRIVELLKMCGEVVAVTGDGVNDAPALKSAHIGAAMGRSGTDVAREAADIVLTDDNFATIFAAVAEGRTAFANIRNATYFLVASGVGELILILGSIGAGLPLPLLPAQILWLNVVTNGIQDVCLALEPGERALLHRAPRPLAEGILSRRLVERTALVAPTLAATAMTVFLVELGRGVGLAYAQVAALTMLVVAEFVQLGSARSESMSVFAKSVTSNPVLAAGAAVSLALHVGALYWEPTQRLLHLMALEVTTWAMILPLSLVVAIVSETHKRARNGLAA